MRKIRSRKIFIDTVGIKLPEMEYLENFHQDSKSSLARDYVSSPRVIKYLSAPRAKKETVNNIKKYHYEKTIDLPSPKPSNQNFGDVLRKRRSCRNFLPGSMSMQSLSNVLQCMAVVGTEKIDEGEMNFYSYPTPGGIHSTEVYVVILDVPDRPTMLTHYDPVKHSLSIIKEGFNKKNFWATLYDGIAEPIASASVAIIVSSTFARLAVKYDKLTYRLALLEAGLLGHHIGLSATSNGLGSLIWASYWDDELNRFLGIDGVSETVTNCVLLGELNDG